ncbi:MAG: thiamine phosphate synthase [Fusobacteriaceae bacterium]|nr:thiamine phosphate synthase [Fusobacteriaceae bacterium]
MNNKRELPIGIYGITDSKSGKGKNLLEYSEEILKAGVKILQYREKKMCGKEMFENAKALKELTKKYDALLIINDDISVAMAVKADGIHVGQNDLPITEVRKLVGKEMIIGLSTHVPEEALKAVEDGADYIGVGPMFPTQTKEDVCAPVGFDYLEYVEKNINIPYVAIGGIKLNNMNELLKRGVKSVAIVSEIVGAENTYEKTKELIAYFNENIKK